MQYTRSCDFSGCVGTGHLPTQSTACSDGRGGVWCHDNLGHVLLNLEWKRISTTFITSKPIVRVDSCVDH